MFFCVQRLNPSDAQRTFVITTRFGLKYSRALATHNFIQVKFHPSYTNENITLYDD